jgi:hypothetical protein
LAAQHENHIHFCEQFLDRLLAILGSVTDVSLGRAHNPRKPSPQGVRYAFGVVEAESRLGQIRDPGRICHLQMFDIGLCLHEADGRGRFPESADDFIMAGVTDQDDGVVVPR